jgi:hypothetical protein
MRRRLAMGVIVLSCVVGGADGVAAQAMEGRRAGVAVQPSPDSVTRQMRGIAIHLSERARQFAPLASVIIPGVGQVMLGNDRFVGYAAVEVLSWWKFTKDSRDQSLQESAYKDIARQVARASFSSTAPDREWTYYETMRDWKESGVYSKTVAGPVDPETDVTTFNGAQWQLAQATSPDRASALVKYERAAIKPEYRWSWRNAQLQYDIFKRTTFKRDDAYYAGIQDLIVIGANHVLSMVDAFATVRLAVRTAPGGQTSVGARVAW